MENKYENKREKNTKLYGKKNRKGDTKLILRSKSYKLQPIVKQEESANNRAGSIFRFQV